MPASSDASFRRYYRVQRAEQTWIVMDAPPAQEDTAPFVKIAELLHGWGLRVPVVHEYDAERGFLLLADLGSRTFLDALQNPADVDALYTAAIDALVQMQVRSLQRAPVVPVYSDEKLRFELDLFTHWYVPATRGVALSPDEQRHWDRICTSLIKAAQAQPQMFVHRDYHSRNLMVQDDGVPGILDFQDAVWGAVTYDLVSLLRDCYIDWPHERLQQWIGHYRQRAVESGVITAEWGAHELVRAFDLMGLQRHLKVIGIFTRLHRRDGKSEYLKSIPRAIRYVRRVIERYPEFAAIDAWLEPA